MRRLLMMGWLAVAALAACGGDSISGSTSTTTTTASVSTVAVTTSASEISTDGTTSATITAVVKDAGNNLITGATVTFGASAGVLAVTQATTDVSGQAIATLTANGIAAGTAITVKAASGGKTGSVVVTVTATQETLSLTTSLAQLPSNGSKTATITALARNANNAFVAGVPVNFSTSSGGIAPAQATTDANGSAVGTLSVAGDPTNRVITVTAAASTATASLPVVVAGTTLTVTGPASVALNTQGAYTVSLVDSGGVGIPNATVTLKSSLGNALNHASVVTDTTGRGTFTVTATIAGTDSITATALGMTYGISVGISAQIFQFYVPSNTSSVSPAAVNLTSSALPVNQPLTVLWTINGKPQVGKVIAFATTRGTLSATTATTDSNGEASVAISSEVAGPATITASSPGVSTQASINFIATVPSTLVVQASPATIATLAQSTITAIVRDVNNNLVEGKTVTFQTVGDSQSVGDTTRGTLSPATAITDSQGSAQTIYTATSTPSATNGVIIQATVQGTSVTDTVALTVGGVTMVLSLGTGNKLTENSLQTQFMIPYTVVAVDAAGNPVANVPITLTIHPITYYKGGYYLGTTSWIQTNDPSNPPGSAPTACPNEDKNFNGILDPGEDGCATGAPLPPYPYTCNADGNMNGTLQPGGTAVASPGAVTTGTDGSATFNVIYPEDQAQWVTVDLIATAKVQGTESQANTSFLLPILATYLTTLTSSPPGSTSPYGKATSCTNQN